jgi:hypothetical protein
MKTVFFYIAIASCLAAGACKDSDAKQTVKPGELTTIQWIDSTKEVGTINEGQVVDISYRFKNTGTKPLVIKNFTVSCGCTVAEKPEQPVAPGEEGIIKASFNSKGKPGRNSKDIYVYANTEGTEAHKLNFIVEVVKAEVKK